MKNQEFQDIVFRYFRGKLADNEYGLLTDFLQDNTNLEYFRKAKTDWENQPEPDEIVLSNLSRLNYQINKKKFQATNSGNRKRIIRFVSVAAILILGLFSGSIITYFLSKTSPFSEELVFETPRGEKSIVKLPDGSEVWLNANSRLTYNTFSAEHRQVELKGEAFFKISRNEKAPFVVRTNECDVEVLGTTFNVMAYDEFGRKEITLLSGTVKVHAEGANEILKPGEALILKDHAIQILSVDAGQASAWVDNKFNFKDIPLSELMKRLENWYDVDITLENKSGREVNYTGTFKNEETIWQVLDAIKVYTPIRYDKTELRQIKITVDPKN
ncbi:MAG: FecR domain-containing protein [Prolixibacteraceae bacterium]